MTDDDEGELRFAALRRRAETALQSVDLHEQNEALAALSPEEARRLLHDLWVYRVELEMQNDELRRVQIELVASRDRYVELFDFAPVAYFVLDESGVILEANSSGATLLGQERSTLVGAPLARSVVPAERDAFHVYHRQLVRGPGPSTTTVSLCRQDGTVFHGQIVGAPVRASPGVCRLAVTNVDEATLVEGLFTISFDSASSGKVVLSPEGKFLRVNPALCAMLGYTSEELLLLSFVDITHPDDLALSREWVRRQLAGELVTVTVEKRYLAKDGHVLSVEVTSSLQRDAAGKPLRFLTHVRDTTERKVLQASAAQNERLATMGQLAAGVAHEINNPLSYVLFNLEGVVEDLPKLQEAAGRCLAGPPALPEGAAQTSFDAVFEDLRSRLRDAAEGAQRIKEIARNLGRFGRVEHGELTPVDVTSCVKDALAIASNEIRYRARVVEDYAALPPVRASRGQLGQVFLNLLINAAHAIGEGQVEQNEIRVRTWVEGDRVCAEVSDTGKGIAPEHHRKVFEPFFTTKPVGVGSGVGLSICKNIVVGFGGDIGFTSELGKGTSFRITFPRDPEVAAPPAAPAPAPPEAPLPAVRGRILVVDDEAAIRGALVRLLGREHEVVAAASGQEAQALLEMDRRFDLVLCDMMMSEMSGMDLHKWLALRDPSLAERLIFVTGGAFTAEASAYLGEIKNLSVDKPFEPASLRKLTNELIRAHRLQGGGPPRG